jgi:hypothetical protein
MTKSLNLIPSSLPVEEADFTFIDPPEPAECSPVPGSDEAPEQELLSPPQFKDVDVDDENLNSINPPHVTLTNDGYEFTKMCQAKGGIAIRIGEKYMMSTNAIYEEKRNGMEKSTNFPLHITGFTHVYRPDGTFEEYIHGVAMLEGKQLEWKVPLNEYKNVLDIINKTYGETFIAKTTGDGVLELLSELYAEAKKDVNKPIINKAEISGWYSIDGKPQWFTGIDEYYKDVFFPDISQTNPADIFNNGITFLDIGHYNTAIGLIFLFAHAGISRWWLHKVGISWHTALIVQGITNSYKTSVVSLIANVFNRDREDAVRLPIALITDAGGRRTIVKLRHQTILVDDYSKSSNRSDDRSRELAEEFIRMNGDSGGHIKAAPGNNKKTVTEKIEGALIFTAEKDFGLSNSTKTRCITVKTHRNVLDRNGSVVEPATFDAAILSFFQQNHDILKCYFASFIKFLTNCGTDMLPALRQNHLHYRTEFMQLFHTPRMADTASILRVQSDLIIEFAKYSGYQQIELLNNYFYKCILDAVADQQETVKDNDPADLFMATLAEILDFTKIAEDEIKYIATYDYYGFYQKSDNTVWLNKEKIFGVVCSTLRDRGTDWLETLDSIKIALHEKAYIRVNIREENGKQHVEYFIRAKKGTRKLMMVVFKEKLEKFGGIL